MAASVAAFAVTGELVGPRAGLAAMAGVLVVGTALAVVVYRRHNARAADHP
jgi:hypothetical protein